MSQAESLDRTGFGLTVLLVGNYAYDRQESMQRFAKVLAEELLKLDVEVVVCSPLPFLGRVSPSPEGLGKWLGYVDKFVIFPFLLARHASILKTQCFDGKREFLVHICDHSNALYTPYLSSVRHLVTCNDLLAIRSAHGEIRHNITRWSGRLLQKMILAGLNRAQRVACISEATSRDLLRLSKLFASQVRVTYMGNNHPFRPLPSADARVLLARKLVGYADHNFPFILHVGGDPWYKNRCGVLEIYSALRTVMGSLADESIPRLIMVGPSPTSEMNALLDREPKLKAEVFFLQDVTNEELRAFYSAAELLLFPSHEEGFGWPISEAQACGCRVITTNKAPMTEVGGDAAVYLRPADLDGSSAIGFERAAGSVAAMLNEDDLSRTRRIEHGMRNAERFSTQGMIHRYLNIYREIIDWDANATGDSS